MVAEKEKHLHESSKPLPRKFSSGSADSPASAFSKSFSETSKLSHQSSQPQIKKFSSQSPMHGFSKSFGHIPSPSTPPKSPQWKILSALIAAAGSPPSPSTLGAAPSHQKTNFPPKSPSFDASTYKKISEELSKSPLSSIKQPVVPPIGTSPEERSGLVGRGQAPSPMVSKPQGSYSSSPLNAASRQGNQQRRASTISRQPEEQVSSRQLSGSSGQSTNRSGVSSIINTARGTSGNSSPIRMAGGKNSPLPGSGSPMVGGASSRRRSTMVGVPPLVASKSSAKMKQKELEDKEKAKLVEKEKQNATRLLREQQEKEAMTKMLKLKHREASLELFEFTRKKDQADGAWFREAALDRAELAAWSLLYEASRAGDVERVRALLDPRPEKVLSSHHKTRARPILVDMSHVHWAAVELGGGGGNDPSTWVTSPVTVNAAGGTMSRTGLHAACSSGRYDVVQLLCEEFDAKIDVPDAAGRPPIWDAARHGHLEVVRFLVDAGAKVDTPDMAGNTATHMAVKYGHYLVVQVLVDAGADLMCVNKEGRMAKEMSSEGSKLSMYLKSLGEVQAETMRPRQDLQLNDDGLELRANHPDAEHRVKKGCITFTRHAMFVCSRRIDTGEFFVYRSADGFRSTEAATGPLPMVNSLAVAPSGLVLMALDDGRIARSHDDLETFAYVNPGNAHGAGVPITSDALEHVSFGAPIRMLTVVDSNIAWAVGDTPAFESQVDRDRALRGKAHAAFRIADTDGSNTVDLHEVEALSAMLGVPIPRELAKEMIKSHDRDGNGKMHFEDFFEWYKGAAPREKPHPLLLRSRNGGHSFERIGIPSEAMSIFGSEQCSLTGVAFGGPNNRVGVVLARFGAGQALLLVSMDGGAFWSCVEPQRWFENERERLEREKVEAAREVARQIQNMRAMERKAAEAMAARKLEEEETQEPEERFKAEKEDKGRTKLPDVAGRKGGGLTNPSGQLSDRGGQLSERGGQLSSRGNTSARPSSKEGSTSSRRGTTGSQDGQLSSRSSRKGSDAGDSTINSAQSSKGSSSSRKGDAEGGLSSRSKVSSRSVSRQGSARGEPDDSGAASARSTRAGGLSSRSSRPGSSGVKAPEEDSFTGFLPQISRQGSARGAGVMGLSRIGSGGASPDLDDESGVMERVTSQKVLKSPMMKGPSSPLSGVLPGISNKKDSIMEQKQAQLQALLEAKKKAREAEAAESERKAREKAEAQRVAKQEEERKAKEAEELKRVKSAEEEHVFEVKSAEEEHVFEIAGRLSRLERDGSKAVLDLSSRQDDSSSSDEDEDQRQTHDEQLAKVLGDDQMELELMSPTESDDDTPMYEKTMQEIKMPPRPDFVPKIDVVGLAEKFLDGNSSSESEEEEEEEEEEEQGDGDQSSRTSGGSVTSTSRGDYSSQQSTRSSKIGSRLQSSRSSMSLMPSRMASKRSMGDGMESSRSAFESSRSSMASSRQMGGVLTGRSYLQNLSEKYTDEEIQRFAQMDVTDLQSLLETRPEGDREGLKLAVAIMQGLMEGQDAGMMTERTNTTGMGSPLRALDASGNGSPGPASAPSASSPDSTLARVAAQQAPGRGSPVGSVGSFGSGSPASAVSSAPGSALSALKSSVGGTGASGNGSPLGGLSSTPILQPQGSMTTKKSKQIQRMATGRNTAPPSLSQYASKGSIKIPGAGDSTQFDPSSSAPPSSGQSSARSSPALTSSRSDSTSSRDKAKLEKSGSAQKLSKSSSKKKIADEPKKQQQEKESLKKLREFTFDKELEQLKPKLQRDLESAEGEERMSLVMLRQAILEQKVEGIQGGPLTAKKIAAVERVQIATQATLEVIGKIKSVCEKSCASLIEIKKKQEDGLHETHEKIKAKEDEKTKLPKRGGDEARLRKAKIESELVDLEEDKTYYIANAGYVEEAIEEEMALKDEMLHGRPSVDTWGCRGLDPFAGVIAGGRYLSMVAVVRDGAILLAGAGGVQRSSDGGKTWTRTLNLSAEVDCTYIQAIGDRVYAITDGAIRRSDNQGVTWRDLGRPASVAVKSLLFFVDEEHGFTGNERGCIYYTCNGGETWEQRSSVQAGSRYEPEAGSRYVPEAGSRYVPGTLSGMGRVPA